MPWDLAESQRIAGKCWPKVGGFFANQASRGSLPRRKKCEREASLDGPCDAPRLNVALARLVDLKAALLAEARARGPDGPRMRLPQLARCSRDQLR